MWRASLPVSKTAIAPRGQNCLRMSIRHLTGCGWRSACQYVFRSIISRPMGPLWRAAQRLWRSCRRSQLAWRRFLGSPTPSCCSMVATASRFGADPAQAGPYAATSPTGLRGARPLQHEITRVHANEQFVVNLAAFSLAQEMRITLDCVSERCGGGTQGAQG